MGFSEIFVISIGLAMDAFAVSICKGLSFKKMNWNKALIVAFYFGLFQAVMPVIGYFLGGSFTSIMQDVSHWIAFILLLLIGGSMIKESMNKEEVDRNDKVNMRTMLVLAIATSIDALTVGITLAFFEVNLLLAALTIGVTTFVLSLVGVMIGKKVGSKAQSRAELVGGIILILIGLKVLLEHYWTLTS